MDETTTQFMIEDPGSNFIGTKPRKQRAKQDFSWRTVVDRFLSKVPVARGWRQKQMELGLHDTASYRDVTSKIVRCQAPSATRFLAAQDCLAEIIKAYTVVDTSLSGPSTAIWNFRALISFSACAVLATKGLSTEAIDAALKACLTGGESWHLQRLRRAAIWTNNLITRLSRNGWSLARASELFFLCTQSIHALSRLQHTRSSDYIIQRLSQPEYVEGVSTDCIPFSCIIPITVYRLTSISGITLREVYDTLGYTDVDFVTGTVLGGSDLMWSLQLMSESLDERVKNLCKQAPDAILLLLLFHALFGFRPFSKVLVEGGLEARQQIRLDGQLENLEIACLGLEDRLARLLTKPIREDCLRYLRTAGIIKQHAGFYQIVASQDDLNLASIPTFWFREALKLGCYYFSGSNLTPRFTLIGSRALPFFQQLQGAFLAQHSFFSRALTECVARSLLNSSRFSSPPWKDQALQVVVDLVGESRDPFLRAEIANRYSIIRRCAGHLNLSDRVIFDYFNQYWQAKSIPSLLSNICNESVAFRAMCGHLINSLAWNAFQRGQISLASNYVALVMANLGCLPPCTATNCMTRKMNSLRGRLFFFAREYAKAEQAFQLVYKAYESSNSNRMEILSYLGDLYCETGRYHEAMQLFDEARRCPEEYQELSVRKFRRLRIVEADTMLQQKNFQRAEYDLSELADYFTNNPGAADIRLNHVRVLVLLARKSHFIAISNNAWEEARTRWVEAKSAWSKYHATANSVDYAVMLLSISDASWELGRDPNEDLRTAEMILSETRDKRQCWIRGNNTDWFNWISTRLQKKGWNAL